MVINYHASNEPFLMARLAALRLTGTVRGVHYLPRHNREKLRSIYVVHEIGADTVPPLRTLILELYRREGRVNF